MEAYSMFILYGIVVLILAVLLYEYRLRKPDQIVLYESRGLVRRRSARFYPRHFSLSIPGTVYSRMQDIEVNAKGKIKALIKLAVTVAASEKHLSELIKSGGWKKDAVVQAAKELDGLMNTLVREFTEQYSVEELSVEKLSAYLKKQIKETGSTFGLDILSVNIQSIEPVDEQIAETIQQLETARILEQTEIANQKARVAAARAKKEADGQIAQFDHSLELEKFKLKKIQQEKEAQLVRTRVEDELKIKEMQLEMEKRELELLIKNPELLMLTPQMAQLAEASQNLRNARTVVSLSSDDLARGSQFIEIFKTFLQNVNRTIEKNDDLKKTKK
jgi:hypothetical protein